MATGDRSKKIRDRIQLLLGVDEAKLAPVNIFGQIDDAQRQLCEELLCLEKSTAVLAFSSGAASEPSGFYKMRLLVLGDGVSIQPVEVSVVDYDMLDRTSPTVGFTDGEFYKRWGGTITSFPSLDDGNYTMYYYGIPTTNAGSGVDPETPSILDKAIEYLVTREVAPLVGKGDGVAFYSQLYDQELARVRQSWKRTKPSGYEITFHDC
jgi:hypothetical protein